jgi:prepilin-type processing-associated H-X9-DG protein
VGSTLSNTYAYNYWGLGGLNPCTGGVAGNAPFNTTEYSYAAALAQLAKPAETILILDGGQLCRPPASYANNANNNGVYGPHQIGSGVIAPAGGANANPSINAMYTGRSTNVAYCDGHVKMVPTTRLISAACIMENGAWHGEAGPQNTLAGNAGWAHDW